MRRAHLHDVPASQQGRLLGQQRVVEVNVELAVSVAVQLVEELHVPAARDVRDQRRPVLLVDRDGDRGHRYAGE
jgi:hypothetical protein